MVKENRRVREAARTYRLWANNFIQESDACLSDILDFAEPAGDSASDETRSIANDRISRLAGNIIQVMATYDALLEAIGEPPQFANCLSQLQDPDGTAE